MALDVMPMKDMRLTPEEAQEGFFPTSQDMPLYPCGLTISLSDVELGKLGVSYDDLCTDDMVHLHCLAVVISKSKNETQGGDNERVSLQITHISAESEDDENEEEKKDIPSRLYKR